MVNSLTDPQVAGLLTRLHGEAEAQQSDLRGRLTASGGASSAPEDWPYLLKDFYLPVTKEQGRFLYQTVRAIGARRVVEFGSSFGVSTIYLAAGLRDNGQGVVIGSELVEEKAVTARNNLAAAGLDDYAEVRRGDARSTLADPGGQVDLLLLDGGPALYLDILQLLVPRLRIGAVVMADNMKDNSAEPHPYAQWVREPSNGFVSNSISLRDGTEYSVWIGSQVAI